MRNSYVALTRDFLKLGFPVVLIQSGMMAMVLVDTLYVGRLGPTATAAAGLGSTLVSSVHLFFLGTLTAIEYFSSRALGQGDTRQSWYWYLQASYLALLLGVAALVATMLIMLGLGTFGLDPILVQSTRDFLWPIGISSAPLFLFFTSRQYLSSQKNVAFTTLLIFAANLANWFLNWVLVEGNLGFPSYGVYGSGLATLVTRLLLCAGVLVYVLARAPVREWLPLDLPALRAMLNLGVPAGGQALARAMAFSVAGVLVARLGSIEMAAHTITLNLGGFLYMVPMGMGTTACILVARAVGENDRAHALKVGQNAIRLTMGLMAGVGVLLYLGRYQILAAFTSDVEVTRAGAVLLGLVALLQLFDGFQATIIGALRGFGDSKAAFQTSLIGLWVVGLPLGAILSFQFDMGLVGLWNGLIFGLLSSSLLLVFRWKSVANGVRVNG